MTLEEVMEAANLVKGVIDYSANVIFGACIDDHMADEVEIVIIATGFNNITGFGVDNGTTEQRASMLSQRIERAYSEGKANDARTLGGFATSSQFPTSSYGGVKNDNNAFSPFGGNVYGNGQNNPNGYAQNGAQPIPQRPVSTADSSTFEPNDPIPEDNNEETPDRKHWPRFMDYFVKKNGGGDNN